MPMYSLLRMNTLIGRRNWLAVPISWMFIWIEASPAISITSRSGLPSCAPIAAGMPSPSVPSPVLAHLGGDDRVVLAGQREQTLDRELRHDRPVLALGIGEAVARAPPSDSRLPLREFERLAATPGLDQLLEHGRAVADDAEVDRDHLVDRGAVDVDVDLLRTRRERVEPPGHAVVEPRADADHHVALVHRHDGFVG